MPGKLRRKPTRREQRELDEAWRVVGSESGYRDAIGVLRGRVAVVSGASRGIGLAIATALAAAECDIVLTSRDTNPFNDISQSLANSGRVRAFVRSCDVRDPRSVAALFAAVKKRFHKIDFLINNAGVAHALAPVDELPSAAWHNAIATNLDGLFYCTQAALPLMREGGVIVNNLSIAATQSFAGMAAYVASKHGALGLTNTLREDVRSRGIRVVALIPGAVATDIWQQFWPEAPREKMVSPEAVAAAVVQALTLPENTSMDEIKIMPAAGTL